MIDLPLTHDEWDWYLDTLAATHIIDIQFTLYDQNEDPIGSLRHPTNRVLEGSVTLDSTSDVSRSLELTMLDPWDQLRFEDRSPAHAALYADRFIGVHYGAYVPQMDDFVYCPVFKGPLTEFSRDGVQVSIEAQGKESLMMEPHLATLGFTLKHRMQLDDAISYVAARVGERHIHLPRLTHKLHSDYVVEPDAELWPIIAGGKHVAGLKTVTRIHHGKHKGERQKKQNVPALIRLAHRRRLLYDARGRLTTRHIMHHPHYVFRDGVKARGTGRGAMVLTRPQVSFDETEFRNCIIVRGGKPKGKERIEVKVQLPPSHPLSPHSLARNGKPRYYTEVVEADNLRNEDDCRKRGEEELRNLKDAGVTVNFDSLPAPFLEEGDRVAVDIDGMKFDFPMRQATIPLTAGDSMAVGYTRHVDKFAHHGQGHHRRHTRGHGGPGMAGPGGPAGRGGSD